MPIPLKTKPEVFIIESLDWDDEREKRFEGRIIADILALSGKRCEYYYVRTQQEIKRVLRFFTQSSYRYLHLSCHGDKNTMYTTLDKIPFPALAELLGGHIANRRLFVSACSMSNRSLADCLATATRCSSILGPDEDILFSDAVVFWSSLYHAMFSEDKSAMRGGLLKAKSQALADLHRIHLNFFQRINGANEFKHDEIVPRALCS